MRAVIITTLTTVFLAACGDPEPEVEVVDLDWSTPAVEGSLPVLDDPIGAEETTELRDSFSWDDTVELEETGPEGFPALHYGVVYLENRDQIASLEAMGIYYSWLPLFPEERERWSGQMGSFRFLGDGEGVFAYVVIPAAIYNMVRDGALGGEPPFRALVLREPPADEAQNADGSLSYEYLVANEFRYGLVREPGVEEPGSTVGAARAPLFAKIIRAVASAAEGVVEGVREGINWVDRKLISGETKISIRLYVHNTDPNFGGPRNHLRRAWGSNMGHTVWLRDVEVWAMQGIGIAKGDTNEWGYTEIDVAKDRGTTICVAAENDAAEITDFLTEEVVCDFEGTGEFSRNVTERTHFDVDITDTRFNVLGQMSDSYDWLRRVAGYTPSQAFVLMGWGADTISSEGRGFAPCSSFFDDYSHATENFWAWLGSRGGDLSAEVFLANDIMIPEGLAATSRGTATHEYGHFVMCDMIVRNNPADFPDAYGRVWSQTAGAGGDPGRDDQAAYVAEAWADFFAWQVIGGVNYFDFARLPAVEVVDTFYYCAPEDLLCMEDNVGGPGQDVADTVLGDGFRQRIAMVATLMHDAFDGQPSGGDVPRDGGAWYRATDTDQFALPRGGRTAGDEEVHLDGADLFRIIQNWSEQDSALFQQPFLDGIANTVQEAGFDEAQTCQLFALHAHDGACETLVSRHGLDTNAIAPSQPYDLTGRMMKDRNTGIWAWWDISPFATDFRFEVVDETGVTVRSGTRDHARSQGVRVEDLPFDQNLTFRVVTRNRTTESEPAEHRVTTFAERVPSGSATAGRGSATISWAAVEATEYVVRMTTPAGEIREVARTAGTEATVRGLVGGAEYVFEVISLNQVGVSSDPSAPIRVTPESPSVVYVSSRDGDDSHPTAGAPTSPFRTIGAALTEVEARGAEVLRLDVGSYSEPSTLTIPSIDVTIEGGYDGRAGWSYTGDPTRVSLSPTARLTRSCSTGGFNTELDRQSRPGMVIQSGADVRLIDLEIRSAATGIGSDCGSVIHASSSALTLDGVVLETTGGSVATGACRVAVQTFGTGSLSVFDSEITGAVHGDITSGADADISGICAEGVDTVTVFDSTVKGLDTESLVTSHAARSYTALSVVGARSVRISRAELRPVVAVRRWVADAGYIAALDATASFQVYVDNTAALTPSGGTVNHALDIGSSAGGMLDGLLLYHVTAAAGASYGLDASVTTPFEGAALSLRGVVDAMWLVNSVLVYAGGGQDVFDIIMTGIDKRRLEADPSYAAFRGNVYSVPFELETPLVAFELCTTDSTREFGAIIAPTDLNSPAMHQCYPTGAPPPYEARANRGLLFLPSATSPPPADSVVLALDTDGRIIGFSPTGTTGMVPMSLSGAGDGLSSSDPVSEVLVDLGGAMRADTSAPGVGAWAP